MAANDHLAFSGLMMDRNMFTVDGFAWKVQLMTIRLQETINQATKAGLKLTNQSITIKLDFKPHEIKTIKIEAGGKWSEVDLINE